MRSRRAAALSRTEQQGRVSSFRDALQSDTLSSVLTLPDYTLPGLSADEQLGLILQDAVLNADYLLDNLDNDDDDE